MLEKYLQIRIMVDYIIPAIILGALGLLVIVLFSVGVIQTLIERHRERKQKEEKNA